MSIFVDSPKRRMPGFERELKPLKAIIHGPPLSGKTVIAKRISARYGAHYVSVKSMIEETLNELWKHIAYAKSRARLVNEISKSKEIIDSDEEDDDMDEEWGGNQADIEQWEEKIRDINSIMNMSDNEMLPDDYVVRLMSEFLAKGRCQSHGYVLDAFPKTYQQAREIFGQIAESERRLLDEGVMEIFGEDDRNIVKIGTVIGNASVNILPDFVISLQATDEFLFERAMNLPENQIKGKYDEQHMIRKLNEFRINNDPENTVLNFFNDIGIHPIIMGVCDETSDIESIVNYLYKIFGPPIPGFGLSLEEEQELRKLELEQDKLEEQAYLLQKQGSIISTFYKTSKFLLRRFLLNRTC
ncbi:adenylate kinase 7-like [Cylas formicarius]|uniref:adenylate kinase 7-like n=1 Tax=Cylas formicarius TaxID=197179 RepID=UPI0029586BB4|nr:adenylate kinase 7-like [Cylas formicarius]